MGGQRSQGTTPQRGRKMSWLVGVATVLLLCGGTVVAWAHGTFARQVEKRSFCLMFAYDDDEPMSHVKATISGPGGGSAFQDLATDRNGVLCFAPDGAGEWRVVVGDGMGHQQAIVVAVSGEVRQGVGAAPPAPPEAARPDKLAGVVAGVGFIVGAAGLLAWFRSRRRR